MKFTHDLAPAKHWHSSSSKELLLSRAADKGKFQLKIREGSYVSEQQGLHRGLVATAFVKRL